MAGSQRIDTAALATVTCASRSDWRPLIPTRYALGQPHLAAAVADSLQLATLQQRRIGAGHGVSMAEAGGRCPLLVRVAGRHRGGDAHRRADRIEQLRQALALLVIEPATADNGW
jgi:hypothetical protein